MAGRQAYLVLGFGEDDAHVGYCATTKPATYDVRRRVGEYRSPHVNERGVVQFAITFEDHTGAIQARDDHNARQQVDPAIDATLSRLVGVGAEAINHLRTVFDEALAAYHLTNRIDDRFDARAWEIIDSAETPGRDPIPTAAGPNLDHPLVPLPDDPEDWAGARPPVIRGFDRTAFPFGGVVFDLDQTLLDTSAVESARDRKDWDAVKAGFEDVRPIRVWSGLNPHDLPGALREFGVRVAVITRAPEWYAKHLLDEYEIAHDMLVAGAGDKVAGLRRISAQFGVAVHDLAVVGDDLSDFRAAARVGARSVHALWSPGTHNSRAAGDIAIFDPETLLTSAVWMAFGYAGETGDEQSAVWHRGSLIACGDDIYALGRYFTSATHRHTEPLSREIIAGKPKNARQPRIGAGLEAFATATSGKFAFDLATSIPSPPGEPTDRFGWARELLASTLQAKAACLLDLPHGRIPDYKDMKHERRREMSRGRFRCSGDVAGARVLLLDDVFTSGSTVREACDALRDAGAESAVALVYGATQDV